MTTATVPEEKLWTSEDLLAMPDDGVERWIIRGQLREKQPEIPGATMTVRNRHHSRVMPYIVATIVNWLRTQTRPRGEVYCGEAGVRLKQTAASTVGVDVVYAPHDVVEIQSDDETTLLDGVPTLVVEILSPNDTDEQINEMIDDYLEVGVAAAWIVELHFRTVNVFRSDVEPVLFNFAQRVSEILEMPGFSPTVAELLE